MASFSSKYATFTSPLHGNGVKAEIEILSEEVIFDEKPLFLLQTLPNRQLVLACGECATFLGDNKLQIDVLKKSVTRQDLLVNCSSSGGSCSLVGCSGSCGEFYCNESCRDRHWEQKGHKLLCTGKLTDEEAETSPLIAFKMHACTTNEIFLMVAELFAAITVQADALVASGMTKEEALAASVRPLSIYVRELWWNAAVAPVKQKPVAFRNTLKALVKDGWALLDDTLLLTEKGYHTVLSAEYMSRFVDKATLFDALYSDFHNFVDRTIGMFEQNNVGVRMQSPLAAQVNSINVDSPDLESLLEATVSIVQSMEDAEDCCPDGGEEGDDDEDSESGEDDNNDEDEEDVDDEKSGVEKAPSNPEERLSRLREVVEAEGLENVFPPLDGTAFYTLICQINHSCDPNVLVRYAVTKHGLVAQLHALRDIAPEEEFVQSYIDQNMSFKKRQKALADYGFKCTCAKCVSEM